MGMFDDVRYSAPCFKCGHTITGWQSKDGPCELLLIEPTEVNDFYGDCRKCGAFNYFKVVKRVVEIIRVDENGDPQTTEATTPASDSATPKK